MEKAALSAPSVLQRVRRVDRGWSWVVLASCFLTQLICGGTLLTIGLYFVAFVEALPLASKAQLAWTGSILTSTMFLGGPLGAMLANKLGSRCVLMMGGLLSSAGFCLSAISHDVLLYSLAYGFLTGRESPTLGIGTCLCYVTTASAINDYFHRLRHLAISLAVTGAALGSILFPLLVQYLLDEFGLSGTLLINGGITLNVLVLAAVIFPNPGVVRDGTGRTDGEVGEKVCEKPASPQDVECQVEVVTVATAEDLPGMPAPLQSKRQCLPQLLWRRKLSEITQRLQVYVSTSIKEEADVVLHPDFLKFMLSIFVSVIGISIYYTYNCEYSISRGMSHQDAAILVSIFGMSNLMGRLGIGVPLGRGRYGAGTTIFMFGLACLSIATFCFLYTLPAKFITFAAISAGLGASYGAHAVLYTVVSVDVLGADNLPKVFGYSSFSTGLACLIAPPLAGWLSDVQSDMRVAFYVGSFFCALGFVMILWLCLGKRMKDKKLNNMKASVQQMKPRIDYNLIIHAILSHPLELPSDTQI